MYTSKMHFRRPMQYLDKGEHGEHGAELDIELLTENGHCQACLHDRLTDAVIDALDLGLPQLSQKQLRRMMAGQVS